MKHDQYQVVRDESCVVCGTLLGTVVKVKEKLYFDGGGGVLALIGFKRCPCCGRVLHWNGERTESGRAFVVSPKMGG